MSEDSRNVTEIIGGNALNLSLSTWGTIEPLMAACYISI